MQATQTMSTAEVVRSIQLRAEEIRRQEPQRFPEAASVGDAFRQGDVYFVKLDMVPEEARLVEAPSRQLAPGTTQGSRHELDSLEGVRIYSLPSPTALDGPIVAFDQERIVTHPEHGHVVFPAETICAVRYQRDLDAEERERRVQD